MADPVEVAIELALLAHLDGIALTPKPPISMPNKAFTPPVPTSGSGGSTVYNVYLAATFLPVPALGITIPHAGGINEHGGILQVSVFQGVGAGAAAPARIAAAVAGHFKRGTVLTRDGFTIRIDEPPYRAPLLVDDGWVQIPVTIPWRSYARNPA